MPRKKTSCPGKLAKDLSQFSVLFNGKTSEKTATLMQNRRVSFQLESSSKNYTLNEWENHNKFKTKKIYDIYSFKNGVILGEVLFNLKGEHEIDFDLNDAVLKVLIDDTQNFVELVLQINFSDRKPIFLNLNIGSELLLKNISDILTHKYFWVIHDRNSLKTGVLKINLMTTPEKMPIFNASNIIYLLFGKQCTTEFLNLSSRKKIDLQEFFKDIQNFQKKNPLQIDEKNVQHEMLLPLLRPYQARAVKWMTFRESDCLLPQDIRWMDSVVETFQSKCNQNVYYNKHTGTMTLFIGNFSLLPKGGILADEMGLGKTVVVISLILNHQPKSEIPNSHNFLVPFAVKAVKNKIISNVDVTYDCNKEIIAKNKETYLNADEKLSCNNVSRGPALKRALTEWYESKLAEYSTSTPSKVRRSNTEDIKCVCGNHFTQKKESCVQCPECNKYQHVKCVGFNKKYIYYCPSCWPKQKLVQSKSTLIVAPASIYHQWFEEINKHVKPEGFPHGVFMYNNLKEDFVQPSVLASYDIVITTYATLGAEIKRATPPTQRALRNEERFMKMSSSIKQVHWWRLCLDEAQMVESDHSQVNEMVNMISAVNRWSITGTPIQKSVNELYHLIEWLRIEPFTSKSIWNELLFKPYVDGVKEPLLSVVSKIFWRNSKEDVADELQLPDQKVKYHILKFSAIEQNFYMREHMTSSADFSDRINCLKLDIDRKIESLDKTTLTRLLTPLLNLRQACSHPMAVKGSKIFSKTGNMTLSELLKYLENKTKVECEDAMRLHISALNGLAGIHSILEDWQTVVGYYRQVLSFTEEYKEKVQIDSLQRIHTMTNLAEILQFHSEGIAPTLRDHKLKLEAQSLEDKYMDNALSELKSDENVLKDLSNKVTNLFKKFETGCGIWWNRLIHLLTIDGGLDEFRSKIELELFASELDNKKQVEVFLSKISSLKGIEIMLRNWVQEVEDNRNKAQNGLDNIRNMSSNELVSQAVDCHLRTFVLSETKKKKCPLCQCESVLLDYECSLFDVSRKVLKDNYEKVLDGAQTKGSWRAKKAEKCLKALLSISKSKNNVETWCINDGKTHMQLLEAMKKEFKQLRAVWMSLNHRIQALDEISMCKLRLRLRLPGEPLPPKMTNLSLKEQNKVETIFIIEHHEVEPMKLKLQADLELSKSEFKKKYGTLLYLKNLGQKENPKPDPCPVCNCYLDNEWCVLQCGHSYCIDCLRIMLNRNSKPSLSCPVCREVTQSSDLSFIDMSGKQENPDISVVGDHSTKVDGILRCLLQLKKEDPKVKVLIFSTWAVVLKILEVALTQNDISFRRMPGYNYQLHLKQFKNPNLNVTALLLPISWGSKGLNLTEANHVFFVEPIMNPAEELQAIGRIHRIGQTKETVVHRFLISGTIEEKIHAAVSERQDKWGSKKATLADLKNLFDVKNEFMATSPGDKTESVSLS